jgi:hypothetical protein
MRSNGTSNSAAAQTTFCTLMEFARPQIRNIDEVPRAVGRFADTFVERIIAAARAARQSGSAKE